MNVKIEITEGCICNSCRINGIEWIKLYEKEYEEYDINFLNIVSGELIRDTQKQYNLPDWIMSGVWDGVDSYCTQETFIMLVKNNKNTKFEDLGHCDECGDDIYEWTLELMTPN